VTSKGWTLGAGVEYAVTNKWILRGKYRYVDLGRNSFHSVNPTPGFAADVITHNHNYTANIARAAISYKF